MTPFIKVTAFALVGCALGYFSAQHVISGRVGDLTVDNEGWKLWKFAGQKDADPYTKAHFALRHELPLTGFEEMTFSTEVDSAGGTLNSNCIYTLKSNDLPSRAWALSAVSLDGSRPNPSQERQSFNTANVIRKGDGSFEIALSTSARPGNWLPLSAEEGQFKIALSLLNPYRKIIEDPMQAKLPKIALETCR